MQLEEFRKQWSLMIEKSNILCKKLDTDKIVFNLRPYSSLIDGKEYKRISVQIIQHASLV